MAVSYLLAASVFQLVTPAQTDWMVTATEGHVKSNYYAMREMFFSLAYSGGFCAASLLIFYSQRTGTQQLGFLIIGILISTLMIVSVVILTRLPPPKQTAPVCRSVRQIMTSPLKNAPFRRILWMMAAWNFFCMFLGGFSSVYQIRILKLDFFHIMIWTTVASLLRALLAPAIAKVAARFGWRSVTAVCMAVVAGTGLLWMVTTSQNVTLMYPVIIILGTIPYAGLNVGFLQFQVDNMPEGERNIYFSVSATFNGIAALLGSAGCSALIQFLENMWGFSTLGLRYIFGIGALGIAATALSCLKISEKKPENRR